MFEIKHLRTLITLAETGNISKAADELFTSPSALSHQLKDLEQRLNTPLFIRNTSPVKFTAQGQILLNLADDILPKINNALTELIELTELIKGKGEKNTVKQLNLAIACHACFQWLLPVTEQFLQQNPALKIEFVEQVFPEQYDHDSATTVDILFTDEKIANDGFIYQPLGTFEVVAVLARESEAKESRAKESGTEKNSLTSKAFLSAADFSKQALLTYPVKTKYLDIFKLFLNKESDKKNYNKAKTYKPKAIKQVANSHVILQMVAANMGITTLPDWLVHSLTKQSLVQTKHIGECGIYKTLYARYQADNKLADTIQQLIPQTVAAFDNLYQ